MSRVEKGKLAVREKEKGNEVRNLMSLLLYTNKQTNKQAHKQTHTSTETRFTNQSFSPMSILLYTDTNKQT